MALERTLDCYEYTLWIRKSGHADDESCFCFTLMGGLCIIPDLGSWCVEMNLYFTLPGLGSAGVG